MTKSLAWVFFGWLAVLCLPGFSTAGPLSATGKPSLGAALPTVTLTDLAGRRHTLAERGKQPCALFFFCGCAPCRETARLWSQVQQNGDLKQTGDLKQARNPTVIVFLGDGPGARTFAAQTGLDLSQTLLLTDPTDQTGQKFGVLQCPRIFVADTSQCLLYTNPDVDGPAPRLSPTALVSRTLTVWRHLPVPTKPATEKKAAP